MAQDVRNSLSETPLCHESRLAPWWALTQLKGFGRAAFQSLQTRLGQSWPDIFDLNLAQLTELGFSHAMARQITQLEWQGLERDLSWCSAVDNRCMLSMDNPDYPEQLAQIAQPPFLLYVEGDKDILGLPQMAMVGSRRASHQGKHHAFLLAHELAQHGWVITSGLARGIDGQSHKGALAANGKTVAALGSGLASVYPRQHIELSRQIIQQGGAMVSEFAPHVTPHATHFPRRNRIISGLSRGVIIVEAALKSGSLITARYALEQNREVFAVPGNISNPASEGCHFLIKQGAKLVTGSDDINEEFQNLKKISVCGPDKNLQKKENQSLASDKLLDSVDYEVTALDVVIQRSGMPAKDVAAQLLEYELRGLVTAIPGGYVKLGEK